MLERILIVDPDAASHAEALAEALAEEGIQLFTARSAAQALARLEEQPVDAILCDRLVPGLEGFDLLPQLARLQPGIPILLLSEGDASARIEDALRRGAHGHLGKPLAAGELRLALRALRRYEALRRSNQLLRRDLERAIGDRPVVAASEAMIGLLERMERAADLPSAVLIQGEIGTGKEGLARALHAQSPRRAESFVAVPCESLDARRLECELFGHARDAFPGAGLARRGLVVSAQGGTLLLDEVGVLTSSCQRQLLQLLREEIVHPLGEAKPQAVDVRVIATSSRPLESEVAAGRFRADLFERLSALRLDVPPLRERRPDIPLLVDSFLARIPSGGGRPPRGVSDAALARLLGYAWPGNLRELGLVIERAALLSSSPQIDLRDLPEEVVSARPGDEVSPEAGPSLRTARRAFEARVIERALIATGGNRTHAARRLGISHRALLYKLKELGVSR